MQGGHGQQDVKEKKKRKIEEGNVPDPKLPMNCWSPDGLFCSVEDSEWVEGGEINAQKDKSVDRSRKPVSKMSFTSANQTANSRTYASRTKRLAYKQVHSISQALDSGTRFSSSATDGSTTASTKLIGAKRQAWVVPRMASSMIIARAGERGSGRQQLLRQRYVHMYGR